MTTYISIKVQVVTVFATSYSLGYELKLQNPIRLDLASIDDLENNWTLVFLAHELLYFTIVLYTSIKEIVNNNNNNNINNNTNINNNKKSCLPK